MKSIFEVSTCKNSCWGCFLPPWGGTLASVPPQGGRKHPQQEFLQVDTSNILFICGGAFSGLEEIINYRLKGTAIGFNSKLDLEPQKTIGASLTKLENQDLLKFGMIPEFIGRPSYKFWYHSKF